ncbi:MAG: aldehyde ferredoxin oxidoreductase family protein [Deltaproteobacteria bacterium]|nr:aldehyde ferredoxin oxidoreductase family protein [Deltaproteobacteria bacterium]MBW2136686.1 aldehyde ferredoxin oxidoreductase family protein [Deltaproteobacteria bacterium]
MLKGYMNKILFIDLSSQRVTEEVPDRQLYLDFLGGYGVGARILFSRQRAGIDPLSPDSTLGFVTGPLTGTPALTGNRYTVVAKSPLTSTWGDANAGGDFGPYLKFAGYDAVFVTGASESPVYLHIRNGEAELRDAGHLWGKDTYKTEDILKSELGDGTRIACIGQAGESLSLISCIINNKGRAAGRSGLGAVMGSKRLKAMAVTGGMKVPLADREGIKALVRQYLGEFKKSKFIQVLQGFGTAGGTAELAYNGDSPVKNWGGIGKKDFPNAESIGGDRILRLQERKTGCWRCPVACGGEMKAGEEYSYAQGAAKPEYETACAFGTLCLNNNLESIIMANEICNRHGLDTISAGVTVAFAIECYEKGLIDKVDTGGIELRWGDHRAIVAITEQMARREGFGDVLADGVKVAAGRLGKETEEYAIHVGGQELPMHDPKYAPAYATSYAIDATPGRHTQGSSNSSSGEDQKMKNTLCQAKNAAGICLFAGIDAEGLSQFLTAVTGHPYAVETVYEVGERISNIRQAFNSREGINPLERYVPGRVIGRPPQTEGPLAGITVDLETRLSNYLRAMDWDPLTAKPSKQKLEQLGLYDVAAELWHG